MFRALPRYDIVEFTVVRLKEEPYYRSFCKIADKEQKLYFEGMAESHYPLIAQLRALAEAYERSCLKGYFGSSVTKMGGGYPYGAGVGFRKNSAIIRAYGEFHERKLYSELVASDENRTLELNTPVGLLHLAAFKITNLTVGTGYGASPEEAKDSAYRSAVRIRDYSGWVRPFASLEAEPELIRITPIHGGVA